MRVFVCMFILFFLKGECEIVKVKVNVEGQTQKNKRQFFFFIRGRRKEDHTFVCVACAVCSIGMRRGGGWTKIGDGMGMRMGRLVGKNETEKETTKVVMMMETQRVRVKIDPLIIKWRTQNYSGPVMPCTTPCRIIPHTHTHTHTHPPRSP